MSQDASEIKLDVAMHAACFHEGDEVGCIIKLVNVSDRNLWVNRRLLLNSLHAPAPFREVWFDIQGPGGKKLDFLPKIRAGAATPKHYGVLAPGEAAQTSVKLSDCFDITAPGSYAFIANYQDGTTAPPPAPPDARHFKEKVRSSLVEFKVAAGRP